MLLIVSVAFVISGYYVAFYKGNPLLDKARRSTIWPAVDGKIASSEVIKLPDNHAPDRHGPIYAAHVS